MIRLSKPQIIIGIVIVLAVAGVAAVALAARSRHEDEQAASLTPAVAQPTTREQLTANLYDFVQRFYTSYDAPQASADDRQAALNGFGSAQAIDHFMSQEKQCIQNVPSSVTVDGVTQVTAPYTVGVTYHFDGGDDVSVNVTVKEDGQAYVIDSISCA